MLAPPPQGWRTLLRGILDPPLLGYIHTSDLLGLNYCVNFWVHVIVQKCVHNPCFNFLVHEKVDQIASVCECAQLVQYNPLFRE